MANYSKHKFNKSCGDNRFMCRLCRRKHPLRICYRFLNMNTSDRQNVVAKYGYCKNCLAHSHSQGTCFTKTGCNYCKKNHHSLLHAHPRLNQPSIKTSTSTNSSEPPSQQPSTSKAAKSNQHLPTAKPLSTSTTTLSSLLQRNGLSLLPTALIKIEGNGRKKIARCLIDSGAKVSSISKTFVDKMHLTTLQLRDEIVAPVTLWSCTDATFKLTTTLRVSNRISIRTPSENLPESIRTHFKNLVLADREFYKSSSIDLILGVDIYSRIITEGMFSRPGIPTAQNTYFGMIVYGTLYI